MSAHNSFSLTIAQIRPTIRLGFGGVATLGVHRVNGERCRLLLGHQIYDGGLEFAYDVALAIRRVFVDDPKGGTLKAIVSPGRKVSVEHDGVRFYLRNAEGSAATVWQTEMSMSDFHGWLAQFLALIDLDEWDREVIPKYRAQLVPMRVQTEWSDGKRPKWADATIGKGRRQRSIWRNPPVKESPQQYVAAWTFLESIGRVPHGAPVQGYDGIVERCAREGIDPRRLRAVE